MRYIAENEDEYLTVQAPPPDAYLSLLAAGRLSHYFPLSGEVAMGREKDNTIVVADQKVSRHHAVLTPMGNTFVIHDQGSANGTYVNGVQIGQPTRLHDNDKIVLGDATFLFTTHEPDMTFREAAPFVRAGAFSPRLATGVSIENSLIWFAVGCMGLAIVALMLIMALLVGLFLGQGALWGLLTATLL